MTIVMRTREDPLLEVVAEAEKEEVLAEPQKAMEIEIVKSRGLTRKENSTLTKAISEVEEVEEVVETTEVMTGKMELAELIEVAEKVDMEKVVKELKNISPLNKEAMTKLKTSKNLKKSKKLKLQFRSNMKLLVNRLTTLPKIEP